MKGSFTSEAYFFKVGFPSFVSFFVHSISGAAEGTVKFLALFQDGLPVV